MADEKRPFNITPPPADPAAVQPLADPETPVGGIMKCFSMCPETPDCVLPTPWPPAPVPQP